MATYTLVISFTGYLIGAVLLLRAKSGRFLGRFGVFYSYVAYVVCGAAVGHAISWLRPESYPRFFWIYFFVSLLAEFAILVEISDHLFEPYLTIRQFGRLLAISVSLAMFAAYVLPSFWEPRPAADLILGLVKKTALTKAAMIIAIAGLAHYYRLPLGRNISGMMGGFSFYLAINVVNFALAETLGRQAYAQIFGIVGSLNSTLCLLVWMIALWRYEPLPKAERSYPARRDKPPGPAPMELGRFNAALTRLLRR